MDDFSYIHFFVYSLQIITSYTRKLAGEITVRNQPIDVIICKL